MPSLMRQLLQFLLIATFVQASQTLLNYKGLGECTRRTIIFRPGYSHITSKSYIRESGETFRLVGLTADCIFYMANMHDLLDVNLIYQGNDTFSSFRQLKGACKWHNAFIIKDAKTRMAMAIVVDPYANKVRVQPALAGKMVRHNLDVLYIEVDVLNREQQVYTQPLDRGYEVVDITHIGYRVFIVARNHHQQRIFELFVETLECNEIHAYLIPEVIDVPVMVADPTNDRAIRAVTNLDVSEAEEQFRSNDFAKYKIYDSLKSMDLKNIAGFDIHSNRPNYRAVMSIPLYALQNKNLKGVKRHFYEDRIAWVESSHSFSAGWDECWEHWNPQSISIYSYKVLKKPGAANYTIPKSKSLAYWLSTTRFFNKRNSHRRMAYPHSKYTYKKFEFRSTSFWIFLAIFLCYVVVFIIWCIVKCVRTCLWKKPASVRHPVSRSRRIRMNNNPIEKTIVEEELLIQK